MSAATSSGLVEGSHPERSWRRLLPRVARDKVVVVGGRTPLRRNWKPCCGSVVVTRVVDSWSVVLYRSFVERLCNGWVVIVCLYGWAVMPGGVKSVRVAIGLVNGLSGGRRKKVRVRGGGGVSGRGGRISYQQRGVDEKANAKDGQAGRLCHGPALRVNGGRVRRQRNG